MKYNDDGTIKEIKVKSFDTLPVGSEVDYDGSVVPDGWTEVDDTNEYTRITPGSLITLSSGFSFGETAIYKHKNHYTGYIVIKKSSKFTSGQETIGTIRNGLIGGQINSFGVSGATNDDVWSIPTNLAYVYINANGQVLMRGKTTDSYVKLYLDVLLNEEE